jgi:predicted solute-binding protein
MLKICDAALLIGDTALKVQPEDYDTIDLTEEWVEWQQKPFVCAVWACRAKARLPKDLASVFHEAKEWGLMRRGEIASIFSRSLDLPQSFLEGYLNQNINYDLEPGHIDGLNRFYKLAREQDLIPAIRSLELIS